MGGDGIDVDAEDPRFLGGFDMIVRQPDLLRVIKKRRNGKWAWW